MRVNTLLVLGRVSNLPTIWTNVLAAAVLAQVGLTWTEHANGLMWFGTLLALSLMYLGGMFLNDAFDASWDKEHDNQRPIVTGEISEKLVWVIGSSMMLVAVLLLTILFYSNHARTDPSSWYQPYSGGLAALALALTIIAYNALHKRFAHSAFIMGGCRFWVYLIGAMLLANISLNVTLAALSLLLYIAGLTYIARHEHANRLNRVWPLVLLFTPVVLSIVLTVWSGEQSLYFWLFLAVFIAWVISRLRFVIGADKPNVKACIGGLLAAIPLLDGLMLASANAIIPSLLCAGVFLIIPRLHRWVSGT